MPSRIIKAASAPAETGLLPAGRVVTRASQDAYAEAQQIMERARLEAQAIVDRARAEGDALRETGRQEGYSEGLAQWNEAVLAAQAATERMLREGEEQMARLAVRAAEKILTTELRQSPEAILPLVREALNGVRRDRSVTLRVAPAQLELVRQHVEQLPSSVSAGREVRVKPDPAITSGGCVVESECGTIDARLDTQLAALEEAVARAARKP
jgi:type III secretion system HrpE/YscL family protein